MTSLPDEQAPSPVGLKIDTKRFPVGLNIIRRPEPWRHGGEPIDMACDGSYTCPAKDHIHGCYSDRPCRHE